MKTLFLVVENFVFYYTVFVILVTLFLGYFEFKYGGKYSKQAKYKKNKALNKLRGRVTILLPLKIFNILFIIGWLLLVIPLIDFEIRIHYISHFNNAKDFIIWFDSIIISKSEFNFYFGTIFFGIAGAKGFFLIKEITSILSSTSLEITPKGVLKHRKEIL